MFDFRKYRQTFINKTKDVSNKKWNDVLNNPLFVWAPELEDIHLQNCKVMRNRARMLDFLPKSSVVAEVGTQYGEFAEAIITSANPAKLHIIDIDISQLKRVLDERPLVKNAIQNGVVELHEGDSSKVLDGFPDSSFDWIYIDGDHSYEGVKKDIDKGHRKLKNDGLLVFNDYTHWSPYEMIPYGVPKAINEFCLESGWEIVFLALDSFLSYQDVAIRKI